MGHLQSFVLGLGLLVVLLATSGVNSQPTYRLYFNNAGTIQQISTTSNQGVGWSGASTVWSSSVSPTSALAVVLVASAGNLRLFYQDTSGNIQILYSTTGATWVTNGLAVPSSTALFNTALSGICPAGANYIRVYFQDTSNYIREFYWSGAAWLIRSTAIFGWVAQANTPIAVVNWGTGGGGGTATNSVFWLDPSNNIVQTTGFTTWPAPSIIYTPPASSIFSSFSALQENSGAILHLYFNWLPAYSSITQIDDLAYVNGVWAFNGLGPVWNLGYVTDGIAALDDGGYTYIYFQILNQLYVSVNLPGWSHASWTGTSLPLPNSLTVSLL